MTTTYGMTAAGFVPKPVAAVKADLEADHVAAFGAGVNLEPHSYFGQIIGIMAERYGALWDALQAVYSAMYPDTATGSSLVDVCSLTGTTPHAATKTRVVATLGGVAGTVVAAGKMARIPGTERRFALRAQTTIGVGGTVDAEFECTETGPIPCYAGALTEIDTPVSGWDSVSNAADHTTLGSDVENDAALRQRRDDELAAGNASSPSVLADVSQVADVTAAFVFQNDGDETDENGMPPHSLEVVVEGGAAAAIASAIWASKAGGIQTIGELAETVTGVDGEPHEVKYSRPAEVLAYVAVAVKVNGDFPTNGADLLKQAIADFADVYYRVGRSVHSSQLSRVAFIPGVELVSSLKVGAAADPTTEQLTVTRRQRAMFDTSRISVTVS